MSAARLAAEAAFAAPEFRAEQPPLVPITTRQMRWTDAPGLAPVPEPENEQTPAPKAQPLAVESDPNAPPQARAPRVFRIETAPKLPSNDALAAAAATPPADPWPGRGPTAHPGPRSRRKASHRQPGPVLHVVHPPAVPSEPEAPRPRLDLLRAELANIGTVLDEAQRASSLQFVATNVSGEWERIWRKGEGIYLDIKKLWL
jgi:hypothetical protein